PFQGFTETPNILRYNRFTPSGFTPAESFVARPTPKAWLCFSFVPSVPHSTPHIPNSDERPYSCGFNLNLNLSLSQSGLPRQLKCYQTFQLPASTFQPPRLRRG